MGIGSWILFGLLAGLAARRLMPGPQPGGVLGTAAVGILGGLAGGFLSTILSFGDAGPSSFTLRGLLVAAVGSAGLLHLYRLSLGDRRTGA